ncbi:hypothetical protein [Bdellovibrio sp. HCB209]|uniref:hypothetical protein n=1 Tax=Bdellovibrio sp. HCB209 TaxID=3394354 RepID=UPI0039B4B2AD
MESKDRRAFYSSTDDIFFDSDENDIIKIGFGPTQVQLSSYAAHDLCYRLASYLIFLEHRDKEGSEAVNTSDSTLADNVIMYPGRKKNEQ